MIIQISDLNDARFGRFGNQLFKYFFLKILEKEIDCEIRHHNWLGDLAFNLPDTKDPVLVADSLIIDHNQNHNLKETINIIKNKILKGENVIDLKGFFQFHTLDYINYKSLFFEVFKLNPHISNQIIQSLRNLNFNGSNLVSIHIRRGDYISYQNNPLFWTTPIKSIFNSVEGLNETLFKDKLIYLCSDDLDYCSSEFHKNNIKFISSSNLFTYNDDSLRLITDFFAMSISNINLISNSSLSFFASMLNSNSRIFLRPTTNEFSLLPYDPWNSGVLLSKTFSKKEEYVN